MFKPRALVDLTPAVSSPLLINEVQWVGIIVKPIDYPLKGGVLHIDTGPGLEVEESHVIEMDSPTTSHKSVADGGDCEPGNLDSSHIREVTQLNLQDGKILLPDWASDRTSVLWIPVRAVSDGITRGIYSSTFKALSMILVL